MPMPCCTILIRDIDDVVAEAKGMGLALVEVESMPANNFTLVFKAADPDSPTRDVSAGPW